MAIRLAVEVTVFGGLLSVCTQIQLKKLRTNVNLSNTAMTKNAAGQVSDHKT